MFSSVDASCAARRDRTKSACHLLRSVTDRLPPRELVSMRHLVVALLLAGVACGQLLSQFPHCLPSEERGTRRAFMGSRATGFRCWPRLACPTRIPQAVRAWVEFVGADAGTPPNRTPPLRRWSRHVDGTRTHVAHAVRCFPPTAAPARSLELESGIRVPLGVQCSPRLVESAVPAAVAGILIGEVLGLNASFVPCVVNRCSPTRGPCP